MLPPRIHTDVVIVPAGLRAGGALPPVPHPVPFGDAGLPIVRGPQPPPAYVTVMPEAYPGVVGARKPRDHRDLVEQADLRSREQQRQKREKIEGKRQANAERKRRKREQLEREIDDLREELDNYLAGGTAEGPRTVGCGRGPGMCHQVTVPDNAWNFTWNTLQQFGFPADKLVVFSDDPGQVTVNVPLELNGNWQAVLDALDGQGIKWSSVRCTVPCAPPPGSRPVRVSGNFADIYAGTDSRAIAGPPTAGSFPFRGVRKLIGGRTYDPMAPYSTPEPYDPLAGLGSPRYDPTPVFDPRTGVTHDPRTQRAHGVQWGGPIGPVTPDIAALLLTKRTQRLAPAAALEVARGYRWRAFNPQTDEVWAYNDAHGLAGTAGYLAVRPATGQVVAVQAALIS